MNRILVAFIWVCLVVASAQVQVTTAAPLGQRGAGRGTSEQPPATAAPPVGQRSGRGAPPANLQTAWWTDTALMTRLGLTDQQKLRIESSFQAYRQSLTTAKETLEKEEAQLARLLDADSFDRTAALPQVNKVIQARSEMERLNATMTVEMREQLTRAQWAQLQGQPIGTRGGRGGGALAPAGAAPDSFALKYAADKPVTLEGKVTEFRYQDPHSFVIFDVVGNDGRTSSWTGELGPSTLLTRQGWSGTTLKPGDKVVVEGAHSLDPAVNAVSIRTVRRVP